MTYTTATGSKNAVTQSRYVAATPAQIAALLLRPLELPSWNPAFVDMQGSADAVVGDKHPITAIGGLRGTFEYTRIEPTHIALEWRVPGLHESCEWRLVPQGAGTVVTHSIERSGLLSVPLRRELPKLPGLRFDRMAEQLRRTPSSAEK